MSRPILFFSYYPPDAPSAIHRLRAWLNDNYPPHRVFLDRGYLSPDTPYAQAIRPQVEGAEVVLAIIGPRWQEQPAQSQRRGEVDVVRAELQLAQAMGKPVALILVDNRPPPAPDDWPAELAALARARAFPLWEDAHFGRQMDAIIFELEQWFDGQTPAPAPVEEGPASPAGPQLAPERLALLAEYNARSTGFIRRHLIRQGLLQITDRRPGVGLDERGLPDIDWVTVPAGPFRYGRRERIDLPAYQVSRYPVTTAQFGAFVRALDGYRADEWWRLAPEYRRARPRPARWPVAGHPRDRVNWYEALAFCQWLSARRADGARITLPTEHQWEKAARGTDGRLYPWGEAYISGYANLFERRHPPVGRWFIGGTTPVGGYPPCASPYGLLDMCGNVWEWTLTDFRTEEHEDLYRRATRARAVRGGAWTEHPQHATVTTRVSNDPPKSYYHLGFRVVRG